MEARRNAADYAMTSANGPDTSTVQLPYLPPYDWRGMLAFLKARELKGVEWVTDTFYSRTIHQDGHKGWIRVTQDKGENALVLEFNHGLAPILPALLARVSNLFDLDAHPVSLPRNYARTSSWFRWSRIIPACACRGLSTDSKWDCGPSLASR